MSRQWTISDFTKEFEESDKWTCSTYKAAVKIAGNAVDITVQLENCEPNDHAAYIAATVSRHINWAVSNIDKIIAHVAEKMTELANDWLDEGQDELTEDDLKNRITLNWISISATGEFDARIPIEDGNLILYFNDDDIFGEHEIELWVHEGYELDDDPSLAG